MVSRQQLQQAPRTGDKPLDDFLAVVRERLNIYEGNAGMLDRVLTLRDMAGAVAGGYKNSSSYTMSQPISYLVGDVIVAGKISSHDSSVYYDLDGSKIVMGGKYSFDQDAIDGIFLGLDNKSYKVNIGGATQYLKHDGSNLTWAGPLTSLAADGTLTAQNLIAMVGGRIGGWWINGGTLSSAEITGSEAEHIRLSQDDLRVSVYDAAQNEKIVMGYLNGLVKNPLYGSISATDSTSLTDSSQGWTVNALAGLTVEILDGDADDVTETITSNTANKITISGSWDTNPAVGDRYKVIQTDTWGASDYGFYAIPGDQLKIDGDVTYYNGDWIIMHDAGYLVQDYQGNTIIRLGTDSGEKGLFLYNDSGLRLAKYVTDEVLVGSLTGDYMQYTVTNGMKISGTLTVGSHPHAPSDEYLAGYWSFNEGAGTAAYDSSGNGVHGTITGPTWTDGVAGGGLDFTGVDTDVVDLGASTNTALGIDTGSFTVSYWFRADDLTYPKTFGNVGQTDCYTAGFPGFCINGAYDPPPAGTRITLNDGVNLITSTITSDTGYTPADLVGVDVHLVVTFNRTSGIVSVIINGVRQSDTLDISSVTGSIATTTSLDIGYTAGWKLDGMFDELRIYNKVLSQKEIEYLYLNPSGPNPGKFEANVTNWMHSSDTTYIDGGKIYTNSITATQILAGTITATEIEAGTITADEIGAGVITADEMAATNLSGIFVDLGSITAGNIVLTDAVSGAQVKIFKTANKGIEVLDDASATVFEAITGGTDVGDVIIGDYSASQGMKYDKSAGEIEFKGKISASDLYVGSINADRIASNTIVTGHITADNVTRSWSTSSITPISIADYTDFTEVLCTDAFTPTDKPLLIWFFFDILLDGLGTGDANHLMVHLYKNRNGVQSGVYKWTESGSGTDEYYMTNADGSDPEFTGLGSGSVDAVWEDCVGGFGDKMVHGNAGSLALGEYDVIDNDSLGFQTLYVKLTSDGPDPDSESDGYVRFGWQLRQFFSQYANSNMDSSGDFSYNKSYQASETAPGTDEISYSLEIAIQFISGGSLTSQLCRWREMVVLERMR